MNINWSCKAFNTLTPHELYSILQLRSEVFVVEQNCVYLDCDDKDQNSYHFMGWDQNKLVAYTRLLPAGLAYQEISIGRVVTSFSIRRTKIGKELMVRSINKLHELFGKLPIKIGGQHYLKNFYELLGFIQCSDVYLEDGIEHIKMILN
ncbi:MAG: GCN5-related N-acetyltransferase [Chitinophagaceae bacterium]|nr:GCN5-related N-acetyltransferase [Chitinophagaceae bacterium]